jgi:hypothetical protein
MKRLWWKFWYHLTNFIGCHLLPDSLVRTWWLIWLVPRLWKRQLSREEFNERFEAWKKSAEVASKIAKGVKDE